VHVCAGRDFVDRQGVAVDYGVVEGVDAEEGPGG